MINPFKMVQLIFSEVELADDVKSFVSFNSNACDEEIKAELWSCQEDDLLKVTKKMAAPIKIIKIEKITNEMLENSI